MPMPVHTFADEYDEIAADLADQSHLIGTFFDDPDLRQRTNQLITTVYDTAIRVHDETPEAIYQAACFLFTYGFYVGREHAARGYAPPIPRQHQ